MIFALVATLVGTKVTILGIPTNLATLVKAKMAIRLLAAKVATLVSATMASLVIAANMANLLIAASDVNRGKAATLHALLASDEASNAKLIAKPPFVSTAKRLEPLEFVSAPLSVKMLGMSCRVWSALS